MGIKAVCVYCSSSDAVDSVYFDDAAEVGGQIAQKNYRLVFGGAKVGLMGHLSQAVHENGGHITGVIPEMINDKGLACDWANEMIVTQDLRQRKAIMEQRSDIFIALPGGFGTLDEILEIITLKQLGLHNKPILFLNTNNYFSHLLNFFEHFYQQKIAKPQCKNLYHVANNVTDLFAYIESHTPTKLEQKWF